MFGEELWAASPVAVRVLASIMVLSLLLSTAHGQLGHALLMSWDGLAIIRPILNLENHSNFHF